MIAQIAQNAREMGWKRHMSRDYEWRQDVK